VQTSATSANSANKLLHWKDGVHCYLFKVSQMFSQLMASL